MNEQHSNAGGVAALVWVLMLGACVSDVKPQAQILGTLRLRESPLILVSANLDRERIVDSLDQAGFAVTQDLRSANLVLEVKLGKSRSKSGCGRIRNVVYVLREGGAPVLQIKGRGGTGTCAENIVDQMSRELAASLAGSMPERHSLPSPLP